MLTNWYKLSIAIYFMSFEQPKLSDPGFEDWAAGERKRMDERDKNQRFEIAKKHIEEHKASGWQLISDKPEKVSDARSEEDVEEAYMKKNKNFWQVDLVEVPGSKDSFYVYGRTKEAAEKSKARHKEARQKLVENIQEVLKVAGFKKQASTWRREVKGVVQVFNLQTSAYSYDYYINLGVFIRGQGKDKPVEKIDEVDCQYRWRLGELVSKKTDAEGYSTALDFDALPNEYTGEPPEAVQIKKIKECIENYALPFFEAAQTEAGVKEFAAKLKAQKVSEK